MKHHDAFSVLQGEDTLCGAKGGSGNQTWKVDEIDCPMCKVILDRLLEKGIIHTQGHRKTPCFYFVFKNGLTEGLDLCEVVNEFREAKVTDFFVPYGFHSEDWGKMFEARDKWIEAWNPSSHPTNVRSLFDLVISPSQGG